MAYGTRPICSGSGKPAREGTSVKGSLHRTFGLCAECGRVGVLRKDMNFGLFGGMVMRLHSPRGDNTRSHDKTMEIVYLMNGGELPAER